jgi:uncharacterized coiled-coil protein SlyX
MPKLTSTEQSVKTLEQRLAVKDREINALKKQNVDTIRRVATLQAQVEALRTSLNRLR